MRRRVLRYPRGGGELMLLVGAVVGILASAGLLLWGLVKGERWLAAIAAFALTAFLGAVVSLGGAS